MYAFSFRCIPPLCVVGGAVSSGRQGHRHTQGPGFIQARIQWELNGDNGTGRSCRNRDRDRLINVVHPRYGRIVAGTRRESDYNIQITRRYGGKSDFESDLITAVRAVLMDKEVVRSERNPSSIPASARSSYPA